MPELPEVESTARYLAERVTGRTILTARVLWHRTVDRPAVPHFIRSIRGAVISEVGRRGKFVTFTLRAASATQLLLAHMRMSGSFDVVASSEPLDSHDRLCLALSGEREIRFHDPRKFGRFYLVGDQSEVLGELGPEPVGPAAIECARFLELMRARRGRIKPLLLNQRVVAGLGNIYVDEALWRAGIDPRRAVERIGDGRLERLHRVIQEILTEAIAAAGTDFGDGVVAAGMYRPQVYGREGEPCVRCGGAIRRIVLGQRGTHLCRRCQR